MDVAPFPQRVAGYRMESDSPTRIRSVFFLPGKDGMVMRQGPVRSSPKRVPLPGRMTRYRKRSPDGGSISLPSRPIWIRVAAVAAPVLGRVPKPSAIVPEDVSSHPLVIGAGIGSGAAEVQVAARTGKVPDEGLASNVLDFSSNAVRPAHALVHDDEPDRALRIESKIFVTHPRTVLDPGCLTAPIATEAVVV